MLQWFIRFAEFTEFLIHLEISPKWIAARLTCTTVNGGKPMFLSVSFRAIWMGCIYPVEITDILTVCCQLRVYSHFLWCLKFFLWSLSIVIWSFSLLCSLLLSVNGLNILCYSFQSCIFFKLLPPFLSRGGGSQKKQQIFDVPARCWRGRRYFLEYKI